VEARCDVTLPTPLEENCSLINYHKTFRWWNIRWKELYRMIWWVSLCILNQCLKTNQNNGDKKAPGAKSSTITQQLLLAINIWPLHPAECVCERQTEVIKDAEKHGLCLLWMHKLTWIHKLWPGSELLAATAHLHLFKGKPTRSVFTNCISLWWFYAGGVLLETRPANL